MSPSIRDLKGNLIEETVDSRVLPGMPDPGASMVEREAIRQAVEKVQALRGPREARERHDDQLVGGGQDVIRDTGEGGSHADGIRMVYTRMPLPADMEAALTALEGTLVVAEEQIRQMREDITAIRLRAEKDAGKLARLAELLKQIGE